MFKTNVEIISEKCDALKPYEGGFPAGYTKSELIARRARFNAMEALYKRQAELNKRIEEGKYDEETEKKVRVILENISQTIRRAR